MEPAEEYCMRLGALAAGRLGAGPWDAELARALRAGLIPAARPTTARNSIYAGGVADFYRPASLQRESVVVYGPAGTVYGAYQWLLSSELLVYAANTDLERSKNIFDRSEEFHGVVVGLDPEPIEHGCVSGRAGVERWAKDLERHIGLGSETGTDPPSEIWRLALIDSVWGREGYLFGRLAAAAEAATAHQKGAQVDAPDRAEVRGICAAVAAAAGGAVWLPAPAGETDYDHVSIRAGDGRFEVALIEDGELSDATVRGAWGIRFFDSADAAAAEALRITR